MINIGHGKMTGHFPIESIVPRLSPAPLPPIVIPIVMSFSLSIINHTSSAAFHAAIVNYEGRTELEQTGNVANNIEQKEKKLT